jgi:O-antigen/teichoic acid export membrane protein
MSQDGAPGSHHATIARNAFHLVLGQVATTALAIVFSAALGRSLGARDFGLYFLISSFSTFAYVLVDWGQQYYVIREVARSPERGSRLLGTALALRAAGAVLVAIPTALVTWALGYDARTCWFSVAFIGVSLPFFLAQSYGMVFRGRDRMGLDAWVSVVNKLVLLALALAALAFGMGLSGVVAAQAAAGLAALGLAARLYRRVTTGPLRYSAQTAREVLAGGSALVTMMAAVSVQPYLDAIILSKLSPADAVGWFGAAKNIMGTLLAPAIILGAAEFPRLSRAASDLGSFALEVRAALRPILWLGALGCVGTYLFADLAIGIIYGQEHFAPAGTILKVYGPGLFLVFIDVLFGNALTAMGRATALSVAKIGSVVLSTALDLILIPIFQKKTGNGGLGVVVAFAASEAVVFAGALLLLPRGTFGAAVALDVGRALGSAAITALVFRVLPPLPFFLGLPLCAIVFSLCSVALGLVRRTDVQLLWSLLRRSRAPAEPYSGTLARSSGRSPVG